MTAPDTLPESTSDEREPFASELYARLHRDGVRLIQKTDARGQTRSVWLRRDGTAMTLSESREYLGVTYVRPTIIRRLAKAVRAWAIRGGE